jgi:hypothetical protein
MDPLPIPLIIQGGPTAVAGPQPPAADKPPARPPAFAEVWADHLEAAAAAQLSWLWHGYLAPGNVMLLTSQWKSGKTTLLAVLLSRLKAGGTLAGLPLAAGKAAVVSEESAARWRLRGRQLDFGNHVCFLCRPFRGKPDLAQWLALLDLLAALRAAHGIDLVVFDTLVSLLPGRDESSAGPMMEALLPLQQLTALGLAVLLLHHPRKGTNPDGQAARGSGALSSYADVLIEMHFCTRAAETDRRRRLQAFSRYDETPRQLVIELNANGTDYQALGDFLDDDFAHHWEVLRMVLDDAPRKLTRQRVLDEWPADFPAPSDVTLWRWLEQAAGRGLVLKEGTGRKTRPFRYWLPGKEEEWRKDPVYVLEEEQQELFDRIKDTVPDPWGKNWAPVR